MSAFRPMGFHHVTERLILRPWRPADADDYRALVTERGVGVPTADEIAERIRSQLAESQRTGIGLLPIVGRAAGDFIGYCGLIVGRATADEPEIAYELLRRVHGHGYATEASLAVLGAAAATGRSRLWATVRSWNTSSFRVLDKLGFARDHVSTDDHGELVWLTRSLT